MHPYKLAGLILGVLAALFGSFMVIGLLLPGGWVAEGDIEISATPEQVFGFVNSAARWEEWTPSPETGVELFGPVEGSGSGRRWNDPAYGQGEFVIDESIAPRELSYGVLVDDGAIEIRGHIQFEGFGGGTRVRWREEGDFGWNPLLGYLALRMGELQGAQLDASLVELRRLVETRFRSRPG